MNKNGVMTSKELKEMWNSRTLGEVRSYVEEQQDVIQRLMDDIQRDTQKLIELDPTKGYYTGRVKDIADSIKSSAKWIEDIEKILTTVNPILTKKEAEGINQAEYEKYMADNKDNIRLLIQEVENKEKRFIENGCKVLIATKEGTKEIKITEAEAHTMFTDMLKETIILIKDTVGDVEEVYELQSNGHKGYDCRIKGSKGSILINTIMAGGYNIQQLHYRTLVYRF